MDFTQSNSRSFCFLDYGVLTVDEDATQQSASVTNNLQFLQYLCITAFAALNKHNHGVTFRKLVDGFRGVEQTAESMIRKLYVCYGFLQQGQFRKIVTAGNQNAGGVSAITVYSSS